METDRGVASPASDGGGPLFVLNLLVLVLAIGAALTTLVIAPYVFARRFVAAAERGERAVLVRLTDEAALRADLVKRVRGRFELGAIEAASAGAPLAPVSDARVDSAVAACTSADGLASFGSGLRPAAIDPSDAPATVGPRPWRSSYEGLSRFRATCVRPIGGEGEVTLVFARRGLVQWKLVSVRPWDGVIGVALPDPEREAASRAPASPGREASDAASGPRTDRAVQERPRAVDGALPKFGEYVYVDELPEVAHRVEPDYPDLARQAGVSGLVLVQALVDRDGAVKDVRITKSIPMLDAAAAHAVRAWTFKPARSGGRPVAVWVAAPVNFRLH